MARKTIAFAVHREGRDKGRTFVITEMPALRAEAWAIKVAQGLARSGASFPPSIVMGWGVVAVIGYKVFQAMPFAEMEPLLAEMLTCVECRPDPTQPGITTPLEVNPVEEVLTLLDLRKAVWDLHAGFFEAVFRSTFPASEGEPAETSDLP